MIEWSISPKALKEKLDQKTSLVLLDVREPHEYAIAHIAGCKLIPLRTLSTQIDTLDPDTPMVVYCHHGMRSGQAVAYLHQHGFTNVQNLEGGIDRWSQEVDPNLPRY